MQGFTSPYLTAPSSLSPLLVSLSLFSLLGTVVLGFSCQTLLVELALAFAAVLISVLVWWKDMRREGLLGAHTHNMEACLRMSFILFVLSEVLLFASFFWAFYDASLSPSVEIGIVWPPVGVSPLSVYALPLLNTVLLLSSGWPSHEHTML